MVHAIRYPSHVHPDLRRVAGYATAIAVDAAVLLLLLAPIQAPPPIVREDATPPPLQLVPYQEVKKDPIKVEVKQPDPHPRPQPVRNVAQPAPTVDAPVLVEQGIEQALPPTDTIDVAPPTIASIEPPAVRLEYADAPAPTYPRAALRAGVTGTVMLQVLVDVDGHPLQVDVYRSSGNRQLDAAARDQVLRRWTFHPAMQDGRAVKAVGLVPIAFDLN